MFEIEGETKRRRNMQRRKRERKCLRREKEASKRNTYQRNGEEKIQRAK